MARPDDGWPFPFDQRAVCIRVAGKDGVDDGAVIAPLVRTGGM